MAGREGGEAVLEARRGGLAGSAADGGCAWPGAGGGCQHQDIIPSRSSTEAPASTGTNSPSTSRPLSRSLGAVYDDANHAAGDGQDDQYGGHKHY